MPRAIAGRVASTWQHRYRRHQQSGIQWMRPASDAGESMLMANLSNLEGFELSDVPIASLGDHVFTLQLEDERRLDNLELANLDRPLRATSGPNGFSVQIDP